MAYVITKEIRERAKQAGVVVKPSAKKDKKLDAFDKKTGEFQASFGQAGANDFHLWKDAKGKAYADERRRLYHLRHKNEGAKVRGGKLTASYLAKKILW
jgi:hypothetical protein